MAFFFVSVLLWIELLLLQADMQAQFLAGLLALAANAPHEYSYADLLNYKCSNGNEQACERLKQIEIDRQESERIARRVEAFGKQLEHKQLMLDDKRPDLKAAYPLVIDDYFAELLRSGSTESPVSTPHLQQCATHYHEYWINKKLWWPNEDGKPNWEDIYVFIIDHYYGFCVKQI